MRIQHTGILAVLVLSASCAAKQGGTGTSTSTSTAATTSTQSAKPKRSGNVITKEELQAPEITSRDAYAAIRLLRPNFFSYRGPTGTSVPGAGTVQVSNDYGPLQSVETLKSMNTLGLVEVRFLNADDAALRFGMNANGGPVIVLLANKAQ